MESRRGYYRSSLRSRGSSSASDADPREKVKDYCRKFVAFLFSQIGVGAMVISYTLIGAISFMEIEKRLENNEVKDVEKIREEYLEKLYKVAVRYNNFKENEFPFRSATNNKLKEFQNALVQIFKHGYDERPIGEVWSFPAALTFSLSVISMIGYGKLVPRTSWGKLATVIYAIFGIPLYVLYFLNMGEAFASCFKWLYTRIYECSTDKDVNAPPKRIIVPSTACLWVLGLYILIGAIMFSQWEKWGFLDSAYFCVTSLCKIGFGDFVPGANILSSTEGNQTKLVINFVYILLGIALVAMCYNLMREQIRVKVQEMHEDLDQCLEDTRLRLVMCCRRFRGSKEEFY